MSRTIAKAHTELVLCTLLLFGITMFFPMYFKTWFVEPTGNIKIAPFFGFLFGIGLLVRKSWARIGAIVLAWSVLAISVISIFFDTTRPGFWIELVMAAFLLYLLYSKRLKESFLAS